MRASNVIPFPTSGQPPVPFLVKPAKRPLLLMPSRETREFERDAVGVVRTWMCRSRRTVAEILWRES